MDEAELRLECLKLAILSTNNDITRSVVICEHIVQYVLEGNLCEAYENALAYVNTRDLDFKKSA